MIDVVSNKIASVLLLLALAATTSACGLQPHGCTEAACTLEPRDDFKLADGDTYQLTVEGSDGSILDESRQVAYKDVFPNGKDCPGHCRAAEFEF